MDDYQLPYRKFPKVPIERRAGAFLIDFVTIWLISSFVAGVWRWLVFILSWLILRVIVVERNRGQSLGRWALDIKLIEARFSKIPSITTLIKREAITGGLALLAMIGLNINFSNGLSMLILISPLIIDGCIALTDEQYNQAYHDRLVETIIIQTERGFSLDLRLKKWFYLIQARLRDRRRR